MKKTMTLWLVVLCLALTHPVFGANIVSQTYDWNVYGDTHYTVKISVENPQLDSAFNVTVKLTLASKDVSLNQTELRWMQVILKSNDKPLYIESAEQEPNQTVILKAAGDSWQETFTFQISSQHYGIGKGQSIEVSAIYKISIIEEDVSQNLTSRLGDSTNDPLKFSLSVPILTFQELVIATVILLAIMIIIPQYIYWRRKERKMREAEKAAEETIPAKEQEETKSS